MKKLSIVLWFLLLGGMMMPLWGQAQEKLGRGVVAVKSSDGVFLSWRSLATDTRKLGFDIYRDGVKITAAPVVTTTNYVDKDGTVDSRYVLKGILDGTTTETTKEVTVWAEQFKKIPLKRPEGGVTLPYDVVQTDKDKTRETYPDGQEYTYTPNDCSVGDVDGDGEYEIIVKWDPTNSRDNSFYGYTGNVYLDCYKLDGTFMWRIDLGKNIRAGAHYTQFMVYDLDGDGKAEIACKTAPGTIDGQGKFVIMGSDDPNADYRSSGSKAGIVVDGPEYLTVFNGQTGAEISTIAYSPLRGNINDWGDGYGNRSERYLACVAYLDGVKPSLVMCRGYYARTSLTAYDFDGTKLTMRWAHDSKVSGSGAFGQGNHNLSVADVDGDGCDEIVYGACVIDHDGKTLYRTGLGHGDAIHLSDLDPDLEGLEVFSPHEEKTAAYGYEMHSAGTGEVIFGEKTGTDVGRGIAADIDPNYRGFEMWSTANGNVYDCKGNIIATKNRPSVNFRVYWDGDLQDELLDGVKIDKWNGTKVNRMITLSDYSNAASCNSTKATPNLSADIFGDWREEVILWDSKTCSDLLVFTTVIPTEYKITTLMHDHVYRMGVAWQNVAYNQPPHLGYYLGDWDTENASFAKKGIGFLNQSVELGEAISPISYSWKNAEDVKITGLPEGLTATVDKEECLFTIEGTPGATGTYAYTIESVGGLTVATLSGTIKVKAPVVLNELAYFPFDETAGTSAVNSVYGRAEAVNFTPTWISGVRQQALELPATPANRRMEQASYDDLQLGTKDFSVELWFRSDGGTGVDWYLFHKGSHTKNASTGATGKWMGLQYKNGNLTFGIDDDVTKSNLDIPATQYFNGEWNHVVCVRDGETKTLKMYINGVFQGEVTDKTGDISESEMFVIGNCNVNFNTPFTGAIDELQIYEGAMSAAKAKERYEANKPTGISTERTLRPDVNVYPLYFTDEITIEFPVEVSGRAMVSMYSAAGTLVYQTAYMVDGGATLYISGLEGLPKGAYMVVVEVGTTKFVKKLLK